MKDCVIFGTWAPYRHRIAPYINIIKEKWSDCDFFVGINPGSDPEWEKQLNAIGITNIIHVKPELQICSDASAYQAALTLYKKSNKNYRNVFFMQTKGMSYQTDHQWRVSRESYFDGFARDRHLYEKLLIPDDVGGCGMTSFFDFNWRNNDYVKKLTKFIDTPYKNVFELKWLITHYVMKNEVVKYFVDNCKPEFFSTNLEDRCYFEWAFPQIVELCSGKKRQSVVFWDDHGIHPNGKELYDRVVTEWNSRKV